MRVRLLKLGVPLTSLLLNLNLLLLIGLLIGLLAVAQEAVDEHPLHRLRHETERPLEFNVLLGPRLPRSGAAAAAAAPAPPNLFPNDRKRLRFRQGEGVRNRSAASLG